MRKYILTAALAAFSISLFAQKGVQSSPFKDAESVRAGAYVYSLPLTNLTFQVKVIHQSLKSGPYAQFAQKYLGISNAEQNDKEFYAISSIRCSTFESADPDNLFVLDVDSPNDMSFLELTKAGLIVPSAFVTQMPQSNTGIQSNLSLPAYTDLGVDPSIYKENATFFSGIKMDTSFVKVPVQKNMLIEKSLESKASDAANFIYTLRKRRVDLISGDIDNVFNNGEALKVAINEINRLENEYLSLFIGKIATDTATYNFDLAPKPTDGKASSILFRFNDSKGVLGENDLAGRPILVDILSNSSIQKLPNMMNAKARDFIYARYPEVCTVKVLDGKEILFNTNVDVSQFGEIVRMPLVLPTYGKKK